LSGRVTRRKLIVALFYSSALAICVCAVLLVATDLWQDGLRGTQVGLSLLMVGLSSYLERTRSAGPEDEQRANAHSERDNKVPARQPRH